MSETHPVQTPYRKVTRITSEVTLRAYEVYCHVYGPQKALIEGDCRGGFSICELIAFLYAYPFPRSEWRQRVEAVFNGMVQER